MEDKEFILAELRKREEKANEEYKIFIAELIKWEEIGFSYDSEIKGFICLNPKFATALQLGYLFNVKPSVIKALGQRKIIKGEKHLVYHHKVTVYTVENVKPIIANYLELSGIKNSHD